MYRIYVATNGSYDLRGFHEGEEGDRHHIRPRSQERDSDATSGKQATDTSPWQVEFSWWWDESQRDAHRVCYQGDQRGDRTDRQCS